MLAERNDTPNRSYPRLSTRKLGTAPVPQAWMKTAHPDDQTTSVGMRTTPANQSHFLEVFGSYGDDGRSVLDIVAR